MMTFLRNLIVSAALAASAGTALGQSAECVRLQQAIASIQPGDPAAIQQFTAAAQRQRSELDRTISYSRSIGCGKRQFLFFGDPPPAECPALEAQIARMQANYEQLNAQLANLSGETQRRALTARYEAACRPGATRPATASRGFLDQLFGSSDPRAGLRDMPAAPAEPLPGEAPPPEDPARSGTKAVCVRTCDGGFFPVSYAANRANAVNLEDLCRALCPNAETMLFTYSPNREIETAVSSAGQSYMSLPNALRFRTKFDPACTCKPPDKNWAQALVEAERLLGDRGRDMIVTPQKAEELSRAKQPASPRAKPPANSAPATSPAAAKPAAGAAAPGTTPASAAGAKPAAAARPAAPASAPVSAPAAAPAAAPAVADDQTREVVGPDGVTRKIRTVGPKP